MPAPYLYCNYGCLQCRSITHAILAHADLETERLLGRQAIADGMRPLRLAGTLRVAEGITTLQEVVAATPPMN